MGLSANLTITGLVIEISLFATMYLINRSGLNRGRLLNNYKYNKSKYINLPLT